MYQQHFGLGESPFSISPDPRYLFMSERHREALAHLLYGLRIDGGFVLLTGEVGTGKTTLCRCLLEQVPAHCDIAFIFNPRLSAPELLRTLCDELNIAVPAAAPGLKVLVDRLNTHLLANNARGRKTVLIVDEAQNLSNEVLELLRLLTNLETSRRKLLQIILLGQPELRERLAEASMRQLAQRIVARYHLEPLSSREVDAYVQHRLAVAGAASHLFAPAALRSLYRLSGGTPRLINLICDRALLGAYVKGRHRVDAAILGCAAREVLGEPPVAGRAARRPRRLATALAAALAAALALSLPQELPLSDLAERAAPRARVGAPPAPPTSELPGAATAFHPELRNPPPAAAPAQAPGAEFATAAPAEPAGAAPEAALLRPHDERPESIAGPAREEHWLHEAMAVRSLFARWQIAVEEPSALEEACERVARLDLHCLSLGDGLASLRRFNSPAILELRQADGPGFLATLLGLEQDRAQLSIAGRPREVAVDSLVRQWNGRYTLLWRAPEGWRGGLGEGAQDPAVAWVDQRLARWEGRAPRGGDRFDAQLAARVRDFQRAHGLRTDGVVGRETLARLAALTDPEAPALAQRTH